MAKDSSYTKDFGEYQEGEDEISCTYKSAEDAEDAILKEILE